MKSFSLQLNEHNQGTTHAQATAALDELLRAVQSSGRAGKYSLTFSIAPATRNNMGTVDKVTITAAHKLDLPKTMQPEDFYWLTDDGETSRSHPRQHDLELRDVASNPPVSFKKVL
jgi:hypothetical protein